MIIQKYLIKTEKSLNIINRLEKKIDPILKGLINRRRI